MHVLPLSESQFPRPLIDFKEREKTFKQAKIRKQYNKELKRRSNIAVNFMRAMNNTSEEPNLEFKIRLMK